MAYLLQIACLALLAEAAARLVRVPAPGFRYAYWRLVLAAALGLPWLWPAAPLPAAAPDGDGSSLIASGAVGLPATVTWVADGMRAPALLAWAIAIGIAVRLAWVGAGVLRLRAMRRRGAPIQHTEYDDIQRLLGTRADLRAVPHLAQPVTFGVLRPVVLLPARLADAPAPIRRAVVAHELVHVQRRDWAWVLAEEALRAAFWFHPAIWWLTSRVRTAREELTDLLTVLATGNRRSYIEALLAFADTPHESPAPAFARRAHLFHRIVLLSKEAAMPSRHIVASGFVLTAVIVAGAWQVGEAFPVSVGPASMAALAQAPAGPAHAVPGHGAVPERIGGVPLLYPAAVAGSEYRAFVQARVIIDISGFVTAVETPTVNLYTPDHVTEPPQAWRMETFRDEFVASVQQWRYAPPAQAPLAFYVAALFWPGRDVAIVQSPTRHHVVASDDQIRILTADQRLREAAGQLRAAVPAPPADQAAHAPGVPLRVGGGIGMPIQTRRVQPAYPQAARDAGISGVVIVEITTDETGRVADARVLRSNPPLDEAALAAVRQWEYKPTLLNGVPVPVVLTAVIEFRPVP